MSRPERVGYWLYVAMGSICVTIIVVAAVSAIVA
jgi:hypothetical protein